MKTSRSTPLEDEAPRPCQNAQHSPVAHELQVPPLPARTFLRCRFANWSSGRARLHVPHVCILEIDAPVGGEKDSWL